MPFSRFEDGDVEIRFAEQGEEAYSLHSHVLALHSPWFKASLSERWNQAQEDLLAGGRRIFELRFEKDTSTGTLMRSTSVGDTEMLQNVLLEP